MMDSSSLLKTSSPQLNSESHHGELDKSSESASQKKPSTKVPQTRTLEAIEKYPCSTTLRILKIPKQDYEQWRQVLAIGKKQLTKRLKVAIAKNVELS
jgi:hypothetical protein